MSRHDPRVSIHQMLEHSRETVAMAQGRSRDDLDSDRKLNLALVRLLEIVGEAASRVPENLVNSIRKLPGETLPICVTA